MLLLYLYNTSGITYLVQRSFCALITSLKWLRTFKRSEGIHARWIETLAEFNFAVEHKPGRLHSNADAVSRMTRKQCWGRVAPTVWIDDCERADELVEPLSMHTLRSLPEFSVEDLSHLQAEDFAYELML